MIQNIFYILASIFLCIAIILFCVVGFYLIRILRNFHKISLNLKEVSFSFNKKIENLLSAFDPLISFIGKTMNKVFSIKEKSKKVNNKTN
ncbi:MAG TPA: hypothetical protein PK121_00925 [Candidatus Pacearchaeota archaeon]|nr:hypothetical protein [Candidatus Pacearchaeota archaeon]